MNTAAANVISASASEPPIWNRIRKTSEFLRKLSLNAAKNWVQNSGAKRRVSSKDEDMVFDLRGLPIIASIPDLRVNGEWRIFPYRSVAIHPMTTGVLSR